MPHLRRLVLSCLALSAFLGGGCGDGAGPGDVDAAGDVHGADATDVDSPPPCVARPDGFDDHTAVGFGEVACLLDFASGERSPTQVKFVIVGFDRPDGPDGPLVHFYEPDFYRLHDEWYYFRLLNGAPIPGWHVAPPDSPGFATVAAIYEALAGATALPLDLRFLSDGSNRLYSPLFYRHAGLGGAAASGFFGLGSLLHFDANPDRAVPEAIWAFDLEYAHRVTPDQLASFFGRLSARLPPEVAASLRWLARSPQQEALATSLRADGGPLAGRVLVWDDLVVTGETIAYNPGIAAGYVKVFPDGNFSQTSAGPEDVVILANVPDDIPPIAALVSAVPQTALAHVNLLAQARGTPNAYVGGILDWGQLAVWQFTRAPVIVEVADAGVRWAEIPCDPVDVGGEVVCRQLRYPIYRSLLAGFADRSIPQVADLASAPYVVDLDPTDAGGLADMPARVPLIGGKAAGLLAFASFPAMETPGAPVAITIRAFHEHQAPLRPAIDALLADPEFEADKRVRFVALEGPAAFRDANADDPGALAWLTGLLARRVGDPADPVGAVVAQAGLVKMMRNRPVDPATLTLLTDALAARFAWLDPLQGLRLRSSATAEDVVGFNGAGLYDSATGYFDPQLQPDPGERNQTLSWALRKTWASYWGFAAFEERRIAGIEHLEGNMGVLVHPRFDDALEDANAVITFELSRWTDPPTRRMVVNAQAGALSVTNPDGSLARPEIAAVTLAPDGAQAIARVQPSSEVPTGEHVLSDDELISLAVEVSALADAWLDQSDPDAPPSERPQALTLDLELKRMSAGWPALASGEVRPRRLVYKQVRVLDRAPVVPDRPDPHIPGALATDGLPRDVRTVARRVDVMRCESPWVDLRLYLVTTEPTRALFPFADDPLVYKAFVSFADQAEGFDWPVGTPWLFGRASLAEATVHATDGAAAGATVRFAPNTAALLGVDTLTFAPDGAWSLARGDAALSGQVVDAQGEPVAACATASVFASATEYLRDLLAELAGDGPTP